MVREVSVTPLSPPLCLSFHSFTDAGWYVEIRFYTSVTGVTNGKRIPTESVIVIRVWSRVGSNEVLRKESFVFLSL